MMSCEIKIGNSGVRLIEVINLAGPQRGSADYDDVFEYRWAVYKGGETTHRDANTVPIRTGEVHHRYGDGATVLLMKVLTEFNILEGRDRSGGNPLTHPMVRVDDLVKEIRPTKGLEGVHWAVRDIHPDGCIEVFWRERYRILSPGEFMMVR